MEWLKEILKLLLDFWEVSIPLLLAIVGLKMARVKKEIPKPEKNWGDETTFEYLKHKKEKKVMEEMGDETKFDYLKDKLGK